MAAIVRHIFLQKTGQSIFTKHDFLRYSTTSIKYKQTKTSLKRSKLVDVGSRIESVAESIASKGFLRSYKPYSPPNNVAEELDAISKQLNLVIKPSAKFKDLTEKCAFLSSCSEKFKHSVPNSQLHEINSISDAIEFYKQSVDTTLPLDNLTAAKLPENLHIISNYHRFQSEEDALFNGQTAFPKSSTLVTGLKYRKKYKGLIAKTSWP